MGELDSRSQRNCWRAVVLIFRIKSRESSLSTDGELNFLKFSFFGLPNVDISRLQDSFALRIDPSVID